MKKALLTASIATLVLSLGGVASASPTDQLNASTTSAATVNVTFIPAEGEHTPIHLMDQNYTFKGLGAKIEMSGSNWLIWEGSNVVKLNGNVAVVIGYGHAEIHAYKSNGDLLGKYIIDVKR
ncbi:hypothetical protein [Paenibacillus terrae]|uniref:hypothetical protein n=1 Tax=Paenibacillus terrae TaxID=159743 RepID=UPI0011EB35AA|nr:hypothetical protein [Paenibacillus terrae]